MPRPAHIVLADDFTGAAEVAGVAHRHGRRTVLLTDATATAPGAEITVLDTDTRLAPPRIAAAKLRRLARRLHGRLLFKKTDSVLRGPVCAELEALAGSFYRVLLVPANPTLGRTLRAGIYRVAGRPVNRTAFARDPHHPVRSADVRAMLGGRAVQVLPASALLRSGGIIVGEASTAADVNRWARGIDGMTLPAGGSEFFSAVLGARGWKARRPAALKSKGPVLVVSGSLAEAAQTAAARARRTGWVVATDRRALAAGLAQDRPAWFSTASLSSKNPTRIRSGIARLVQNLHQAGAFSHLVIEGGATAAVVAARLGWTRFTVLGEWAPGVVALRPAAAPRVTLTLKPGSYAWPANLWTVLAARP